MLISAPQQKARDNRAALRINKVQMSNDTVKRHPPQPQPPEVFDPNLPLDTELLFKDPLKPKESEHEQEWKFRQVRVYAVKSGNSATGPPFYVTPTMGGEGGGGLKGKFHRKATLNLV